jgi:hypothetical protein
MGLRHTYIQLFSGPYKDIGPLFFRIFLLPSVFRIYECLFMCFFPYKVFFFFFFLVFLPHLYLGMSVYLFLFFFRFTYYHSDRAENLGFYNSQLFLFEKNIAYLNTY